jgi:hypothetical protein
MLLGSARSCLCGVREGNPALQIAVGSRLCQADRLLLGTRSRSACVCRLDYHSRCVHTRQSANRIYSLLEEAEERCIRV